MAISPVVQREVRIEARNRWNYLLRVIGAGGCGAVAWGLLRDAVEPSAALGMNLFGSIHSALLLAIWILVPALTADCVSGEKREGTLGLLFLTGLRSESIVLGKGFAHMLRALTLWLAAFPFISIPLFLGGVGWLDIGSAFVLQACAMFLALGAGLVASGLTMNPVLSIVLAESIALGMAWAFSKVLAGILAFSSGGLLSGGLMGRFDLADRITGAGTTSVNIWSGVLAAGPKPLLSMWIGALMSVAMLALSSFLVCIMVASWRVRLHWKDQPPSAGRLRWRQFWFAPRFWKRAFVQHRGRVLDRNPMGWLESYPTRRRLAKLGWSCVILFVNSWLMAQKEPWTYFEFAQMWLALLLTLHLAADAATLFRQERETGALELLLVAPLTVDQLIASRLVAFWKRFFAPVALAFGLSTLMLVLDIGRQPNSDFRVLLILNYLTVPVLGFWLSLRARSFATAFLVLVFFGIGLPVLLPMSSELILQFTLQIWPWFFEPLGYSEPIPRPIEWTLRAVQLGAAVGCWLALRRMLAERTFITKSELVELTAPRAVKWQSA